MNMISVWRLADDEQIAALAGEPDHLEEALEEDGPDMDLDCAWHGIHFLLAGSVHGTTGPRGYILGGRPLGNGAGQAGFGYASARALSSSEVALFDDFLQCISMEDFRHRFDPQAMIAADVYPGIWERAQTGEEDVLGYLAGHFVQLKQFIAAAHRDGMGMITYLA